MEDEILSNVDNPGQLERLYRADKSSFKNAFKALYPELKEKVMADFWNERLNFAGEDVMRGNQMDWVFVVALSLLAGLAAKIPMIFSLPEDAFFQRNIGFITFPWLIVYFAWKQKLSYGKMAFIGGAMLTGLLFINFFPSPGTSDTLMLSCIYLLFMIWGIIGFTFIGDDKNRIEKSLGYLRYTGDLVVMSTLILISGGIMTGVTIGLFSLIGLDIAKFYGNYVIVTGLAAAPIVGTHLVRTNPQLVGKVSPVIAKIFSPLVLVMLLIYLIAMVYSGKDPYNDREFLLIFNGLLAGVMAIIIFSVAETSATLKTRTEIWILFLLSVTTIVVNGIALSAILFRISELGITPNRVAVLGSNLVILGNLLLVTFKLFKVIFKKGNLAEVGKVIALYLPVYFIWAAIITFLFPLLFNFK